MKRMLAVLVLAAVAGTALAQARYPAKPIRFIAPFPTGGTSDVISRLLAQKLGDVLGQSVVVENRPGANANIGHEIVAKAPADGYTLLMSNSQMYSINTYMFRQLPFDPYTDFLPVSVVAIGSQVLVVHPSVAVQSVGELVALTKAKPGVINYGSGGRGSTAHISGEMFRTLTAADITHIPYKGIGQAVLDLVGGSLHFMFSDMVPAIPHIRAGKLRALGVTSDERSPALPEVPTMKEAGAAGYRAETWWAIVAPKGTSREIIMQLNAALAQVMKQPDVVERYTRLGIATVHTTPERVHELAHAERPVIQKILKAAGLEPE